MSLLALQRLVLPPLSTTHTALFLDFDGTLVDLAPQPDAVHVPPELVQVLQRLAERLDGALAVVSGRRLADLDHFLAPLKLPLAAEHGALRRLASGRLTVPRPPVGRRASRSPFGLRRSTSYSSRVAATTSLLRTRLSWPTIPST